MDQAEGNDSLIDPEVKAFVFSLVSALGGSSAADDGRYVLGDDALAALKDIKRWLRLYDDKTDRLDVARLLAEANLVRGDLLEILASWPEDAPEGSLRSKAALLCADLLTQLTWPLQKDAQSITMHHLVHRPFLQTAQASYKRAILHHDRARILRTIMRVSLPAIAQPQKEREPVQDSIIKVVLYLFRNVAMITQPESNGVDEDDMEISRSVTIDIFHHQDILSLLLTIGSSMTDDFSTHDVEMLDVIFHLVKGIDVERLFMDKDKIMSSNTRELQGLLGKERIMLAGQTRHASSRHNRFGTMMWKKRDDGRMSTVLGQTAAPNDQTILHDMDKSKKWKKPRRPMKQDSEDPLAEFSKDVPLTGSARRQLRNFVGSFLDSSFNPLFLSVRRSIEREAPRVLEYHKRQYFFLISWFLRAEHARRKKQAADRKVSQSPDVESVESFGLVAAVLNQETFVLLNRTMQTALDNKNWQDVNACMRCFTQVLQTVHEMSESPLEEDQEISENTLNRIFYEQTTHDRIILLLRTYNGQGLGYLDACTELAHVFLRLLELYSKQNVDMQVRSIRRARKKKKVQLTATDEDGGNGITDHEMEAGDVAEAQKTFSERRFDFNRFAAKFINQSSIDTFMAFVKFHRDLSTDQLKRAHRFLYRAAFKMDLAVYLFRADIVMLLNKLVKGPGGMDTEDPTFKEWDELARHVFRKLLKRMEERPALGVELLFSKIPSTLFYLEHGYEREVPKKSLRLPAELEVKPGMDTEQQIGVAVSVLINQSKSDALAWVKGVLKSAANERQAWEEEAETRPAFNEAAPNEATEQPAAPTDVQPPTDAESTATAAPQPKPKPSPILVRADNAERRKAMQSDKHLRLLLTLLSFDKLDITESDIGKDGVLTSWTIPGSLSSIDLTTSHDLIARFEFAPPSYEDGRSAEDFLRRKYVPGTIVDRVAYRDPQQRGADADSDSEGGSLPSDVDAALFPAGGPTPREPDQPREKKTKRRLNRHKRDELIPESVLEERRAAKRKLERERTLKVKSDLFVSKSDDESDEERDRVFFEGEEQLRSKVGKKVVQESRHAREYDDEAEGKKTKKSTKARKRKAAEPLEEVGSDDDDAALPTKTAKRPRATTISSASDADTDSDLDLNIDAAPALPTSIRSHARSRPRAQAAAHSSLSTPPSEMEDVHVETTAESEADTDTPASSQRPSSGHVVEKPGADDPDEQVDVRDAGEGEDGAERESEEDNGDSDKENIGVRKPASAKAPPQSLAAGRRAGRRAVVVEDDSDE